MGREWVAVRRRKETSTCGALSHWAPGQEAPPCLVPGTGLGAPGPLRHQLRDTKDEDGWSPFPLRAFTWDRCSGEMMLR